jgi:hypothetical protein
VVLAPDVVVVVMETLTGEFATNPWPETVTVPPGGTTPVAEIEGRYTTLRFA